VRTSVPAFLLAGVFQRRRGAGLFGFALRAIQAVVAAVAVQAVAIQFHDAFHQLQQCAVVADNDRAARPLVQAFGQPCAAFRIEVVGRFVQQQAIGAGQESAGQRNPHALTAAKRGCWAGRIERGQPGIVQCLAQGGRQGPVAIQQFDIAVCNAAAFHAVQRVEQVAQARQRGDRVCFSRSQFLRHAQQRSLAPDGAGRRRDFARQHPRQHALARAIGADQAGQAGLKSETEVFEQQPAARQAQRRMAQFDGNGHMSSLAKWNSRSGRAGAGICGGKLRWSFGVGAPEQVRTV
jgi:hypothetical protein